jgi:hypothetical protein
MKPAGVGHLSQRLTANLPHSANKDKGEVAKTEESHGKCGSAARLGV